MRRLGFASTAFVAWTTLCATAMAALPPQYQRLKELRAILEDGRIVGAFDLRHPIDRIERIEPDLYRITGGSCSMDVAVRNDPAKTHPPGWAGPRDFVLDPRPLVCR